jgi:hypothetical protein
MARATKVKMARPSHGMPAWRAFGAALAAFSVGVQILGSGLLIGQIAAAAEQPELSVICSHDGAAAGGGDDGTGPPSRPQTHGQCPACPCPQSVHVFVTPPASPSLALLRPRSQRLEPYAGHVPPELDFHTPYASRAPPHSA